MCEPQLLGSRTDYCARMGRSDKWSDAVLIAPVVSGPDANPELAEALRQAQAAADLPDRSFWQATFGAAKEVIFRVEDDGPHIAIVGFSLDAKTGCLSLSNQFDVFDMGDDDGVKGTIAHAITHDVPIYPETPSDIPKLVELYESIFAEGFEVPTGDGRRVTVRPSFKDAHNVALEEIDDETRIQPLDYWLRERRNADRIRELVEAERVVVGLQKAVEALEDELKKEVRDEHALQRILTDRPSLLGIEYREIIPKHSLGGEYELDYAAITTSGFVHCIEIEPSTMHLYTKAGNPRADLVHAEQQVLDWLDWLDRHTEYASSRLPTVLKPTGTVIIGRRADLSDQDKVRLERRNAAWNGTLRVLTYDDLLDQARATLSWLTSGFALKP